MTKRPADGAWRALLGTVLFGAALAVAPLAAADPPPGCPRGSTLVRTDTRLCPPLPRQPPPAVSRACCQNAAGKLRCEGFPPCPRRSPS